MSELKPCPFCGPEQSQVSLWHDDVSQRWRVSCGRCGASSGIHPRDKTQAPAIEAWNTRPESPANPAEPVTDEGFVKLVDELRHCTGERIAAFKPFANDSTHGEKLKRELAARTRVLTAYAEAIKAAEVKVWKHVWLFEHMIADNRAASKTGEAS